MTYLFTFMFFSPFGMISHLFCIPLWSFESITICIWGSRGAGKIVGSVCALPAPGKTRHPTMLLVVMGQWQCVHVCVRGERDIGPLPYFCKLRNVFCPFYSISCGATIKNTYFGGFYCQKFLRTGSWISYKIFKNL